MRGAALMRLRVGRAIGATLLAGAAAVAAGPAHTQPEPPRVEKAGAVTFDAGRAFEHVRQLVSIGPRPAGSAGIEQARRYIEQQLAAAGLAAVEQAFEARTPVGRTRMVNVSATIRGASANRLLITGHYDTKLFHHFRFVGANDGGSSTAMLLELARVLAARKNALTVEIVFFDGEEAVIDWTGTDHTYGSRHYVAAARAAGTLSSIRGLVLLDMVGDRHLTIRRESASTPSLTHIIWATARRLGHGDAFRDESLAIEDDHVPFLQAGIPAVNIIDFEYPPWHTAADTIDQISARSLQTVGDVVLAALPDIEKQLSR